ncbi:MAG: response regulator [Gammaproteobacteria bacterium]|jgi:CheY-like chemotaxis protein/HPt (histidine-containing phosphotransfer) domain-containing protein|nr:hypothetical protein [Rhodocyclaceae bacterium]
MDRPSTASDQPRALVVEDDPLYATFYRETLLSAVPGISIASAENGYDALLYLAQNWPDLVILDLHMPGFDGFEFLDIVKRKYGLVEVPILVVSAASHESMRPLLNLPQVHVFTKPLRPALLKKLIRQILPDAGATPPKPAPSGFDAPSFEAFVGPDWQLQREIARQFYELAPDRIARLELASRTLDHRDLQAWCQTLTGTAAMIGADRLDECLGRLQRALDRRDIPAIRAEVAATTDELRHLSVVLDHEFDLDDANR